MKPSLKHHIWIRRGEIIGNKLKQLNRFFKMQPTKLEKPQSKKELKTGHVFKKIHGSH